MKKSVTMAQRVIYLPGHAYIDDRNG